MVLGDSVKSNVVAVIGWTFDTDELSRVGVELRCCRSLSRTLLLSSLLVLKLRCWFWLKSVRGPVVDNAVVVVVATAGRDGGSAAACCDTLSCARLRSLMRACDIE